MKDQNRVKTVDAARELHTSYVDLTYKMQHGMLPIGTAYKRPGSSKWTYIIYRKLLEDYKREVLIDE